MLEFPETISFEGFRDPPVDDVADALQEDNEVSRQFRESEALNKLNIPKCSVVKLWIENDDASKKSTTFLPVRDGVPHGDLGPTAPERFWFAPVGNTGGGAPLESVKICWEIKGAQNVESARLELYRMHQEAPVWTKDLVWVSNRLVPTGTPPTDPAPNTREKTGSLAWTGELGAGCVNVADSPYKLRLVLTATKTATREPAYGWTYFDVRVHGVELSFGDENALPKERPDIAPDRQDEVLAWEQAIVRDLKQKVTQDGRFDTDQSVTLDANRFITQTETTARRFEVIKERWGAGARIPIKARLTLKNSKDQPADQCAHAIGSARVLWDWSDPRTEADDPDAAAMTGWVRNDCPDETKNQLKEVFRLMRERAAPPSYNCPDICGGNHGPEGQPLFEPLPGAPALDPVQARAASRLSALITGLPTAESGVLFRPFRAAGDTYRVAAYLVVEPQMWNADWARTPKALWDEAAAKKVPAARSGTITVRHKVKTAIYALAGVNVDANFVKDVYKVQGGTDLEVTSAALDENRYLSHENDVFKVLLTQRVSEAACFFIGLRVIRTDVTGDAVAFVDKGAYDTDRDNIIKTNAIDTLTVADGGTFGILGPGEPLYEKGTPTAWRGLVFGKTPPSTLFVLTVEGALPGGGTLVANNCKREFPLTRGGPAITPQQRTEFGTVIDQISSGLHASYSSALGQFKLHSGYRCLEYLKSDNFTEGAAIFVFRRMRSTDAFPSGSAIKDLSTPKLGLAMAGFPALPPADAELYKKPDPLVVHELGHTFYLSHAVTLRMPKPIADLLGQSPWNDRVHEKVTDGNRAALINRLKIPNVDGTTPLPEVATKVQAAAKPNNSPPLDPYEHHEGAPCVMNYEADSTHFCAFCMLRLRGWRVGSEGRITLPRGDVLMVPKARFAAERLPIELKVKDLSGCDWRFVCRQASVRFYTQPAGGNPIILNNGEHPLAAADLTRGITLYAEGVAADAAVSIAVKPAISNLVADLAGTGSSAQLICVDVGLDACKQGHDRKSKPEMQTEAERHDLGRFIHRQDEDSHHKRAKVIIYRADPPDWNGEIEIACDAAKLRLFRNEKARRNDPGAASIRIPNGEIPPDKGLPIWVEGREGSAHLRDAVVSVGVPRLGAGDQAKFTVVEVRGLKAIIPGTTAKTDRTAHGYPSQRKPQEFVVQRGWKTDFKPEQTLVLISDSLAQTGRMEVRVDMSPPPRAGSEENFKVEWVVERATGSYKDSDQVIQLSPHPIPTMATSPYADPTLARLMLDAVGSFYVRATVDLGDAFGPDEPRPAFSLNLVLVHASATAISGQVGAAADQAPGVDYGAGKSVHIPAGHFAHAGANGAGVYLSATVKLVGGGKDGRRGLLKTDRTPSVYTGWIQNIVKPRNHPAWTCVRVATYKDLVTQANHAVEQIFTYGRNAKDYVPGEAAPERVDFPILDKSHPRTLLEPGGWQIMLSASAATNPVNAALGMTLDVTAHDSPEAAAELIHAARKAAVLQSMEWELSFSAFLCIGTWAADRAVGVLGQVDWNVQQQLTLDWTAAAPTVERGAAKLPATAPGLNRAALPGLTVSPAVNHNGVKPASDTDLEIGQPGAGTSQADDAQA